ncbi:MAG: DUF1461 domain-containing protein [Nanoarchaeota archaeon]
MLLYTVVLNPQYIQALSPDQSGAAADIIEYLDGEDVTLPVEMSTRESLHMQDVRRIFSSIRSALLQSILAISIITLLLTVHAYAKSYNIIRHLRLALRWAAIAGGSATTLLLLSVVVFPVSLNLFHYLAFDNELWMLPPESYSLLLFPRTFFLLTLLSVLLYIGIFSLLMHLLVRDYRCAYISRKMNRHEHYSSKAE